MLGPRAATSPGTPIQMTIKTPALLLAAATALTLVSCDQDSTLVDLGAPVSQGDPLEVTSVSELGINNDILDAPGAQGGTVASGPTGPTSDSRGGTGVSSDPVVREADATLGINNEVSDAPTTGGTAADLEAPQRPKSFSNAGIID